MQLYCSNGLGQPLAKWIKVDVSINVAVGADHYKRVSFLDIVDQLVEELSSSL